MRLSITLALALVVAAPAHAASTAHCGPLGNVADSVIRGRLAGVDKAIPTMAIVERERPRNEQHVRHSFVKMIDDAYSIPVPETEAEKEAVRKRFAEKYRAMCKQKPGDW